MLFDEYKRKIKDVLIATIDNNSNYAIRKEGNYAGLDTTVEEIFRISKEFCTVK